MGIAAYNRGSRAISAYFGQQETERRTVQIVRPHRMLERIDPAIASYLLAFSRKIRVQIACSRDMSLPPRVRESMRQTARDIAANCRAFWQRVRD